MTPSERHEALEYAWRTPPGWTGALKATNHSQVGLYFIVTALIYFAIGGVLAMLIRTQLATPDSAFMGPEIYNQIFTMHGTVMMFLFAIPLIEGLAIYFLPKLLGTRDMAFPRLGAFGYWCYAFGGAIILISMFAGVAPDGGWFMYTPLTSRPWTPGISADVWLLGVTFVEISAICAAVEIVVTVLKMRAPGMSLAKMPLMAWALLVAAVMILAGFPPLILASILLEIERAFGWPFFDPNLGGDPLLWQHLFWLFGHPDVYIIFLPAAGAISTILPVFAQTRIVGYSWIVAATVSLAFISFGLWVHHMFTVGIPHLAQSFFSAASMLVAIPMSVLIFAWLATLLRGRPKLELPMLYLLGFFAIFVIGGLTGVMVALVPFNWQIHDTHFVVAHLHYVLVGGFVFPMMAALYYWLPLVTGRRATFDMGKAAFWLIFIGFNVTFFLMHLTGLLGMPRRIYTYPAEVGWGWLNLLSSVGGFVMTAGFVLLAADILLQLRFGRKAKHNEWHAPTLEWALPSPPPSYNLLSQPEVTSREPLADDPDFPRKQAMGEGYLAEPRRGWRETLGLEMVTGRAEHIIVMTGPGWTQILTAGACGVFFLSVLFQLYWLAIAGAFAVLGMGLRWAWTQGTQRDEGALPAGLGLDLPTHWETGGSPPFWGLIFTLVLVSGAFFATLVFGYLFLWVIAPNWPPPAMITPDWISPAIAALGLLIAAGAAHAAQRANAADLAARRDATWIVTAAASAAATAGFIAVPLWLAPPPTSHAYAAATVFLALWCALHTFLTMVYALYALARARAGYVSRARCAEARATAVFASFTALIGLVGLVLIHGMPWTAPWTL